MVLDRPFAFCYNNSLSGGHRGGLSPNGHVATYPSQRLSKLIIRQPLSTLHIPLTFRGQGFMHGRVHLICITMLPGFHIPAIMVSMTGILPPTRMVGMESVDPCDRMGLSSPRTGLGDVFLSVTSTVRVLGLTVNQLLGLIH